MLDLRFHRICLTITVIAISSIGRCLPLTLCPNAVWQRDALTVAGSQESDSGSDAASLEQPTDVNVISSSMIYVLDSLNYRVQRFRANSTVGVSVIGGTSTVHVDKIFSMLDMSVDANGSIYILDTDDSKVVKWTPGRSTLTIVAGGNDIGDEINQLDEPYGMFVDPLTTVIWIADTNNHRIVQWTSPLTSVVVCGEYGSDDDQFINPQDVFVDTSEANTLYVVDTNNHRIQLWRTGATKGTTVAGITSYYGTGLNQLWLPTAVMVDNNRNMFIVDSGNNRILEWPIGSSSGMIIAGHGDEGIDADQLASPNRIDFDSSGSLYVADTNNHRIQKFAVSCPTVANTSTTTLQPVTTIPSSNTDCAVAIYASHATTIAGSSIGDWGETPLLLNEPSDTVIDKNGTVYVLDALNDRVQRFTRNSMVGTTVVNATNGDELNQLDWPIALSVDVSGNIFILDGRNSRVVKWTPGAASGVAVAGNRRSGANLNQLNNPRGFFIGPNTSVIWIADTGNSRIVKWESPVTGSVVYGSQGVGAHQFDEPMGVFVDTSASNTLYVADTNNHRAQRWLPGATSGTTVAGQTSVCSDALNRLCYPVSVTKDDSGFIYIVDGENQRVMRWLIGGASGEMVSGDVTRGVLPNQLNEPATVKLDPEGALIVTDTKNSRVQRFENTCGSRVSTAATTTTTTTTTQRSASPVGVRKGSLALLSTICSMIVLLIH